MGARRKGARGADNRSPGIAAFQPLATPDFNPSARTSQAMIWFANALHVGTGRAPLGFLGRYTATDGGQSRFASAAGNAQSGGRDEDGAEMWRYDPASGQWRQTFNSPIVIGGDGKERARDRSVRAALVCQTAADSAPALYLGMGSLEGQVVFLRSEDGLEYAECRELGFGIDGGDLPSVRTMCALNGRLFTSPTGKIFGRGMLDDNMTDFPQVFCTDNPLTGTWQTCSEPAFGDQDNLSINELAVFGDHLYAATLNTRRGYQVWKTPATGKPPYRWTCVIKDGAWRGPKNSIPASMYEFKGALYIGGTLQRQGRVGMDKYGPFAADMIRIHADDSWDLVSGEARFTPHGLKAPVSGLSGGFGDMFTHAFWRMAEYGGRLYVGTAGWRWLPTYLRGRDDISEARLEFLREQTAERIDGEFAIWRSADGVDWEAVTTTGFEGGNPNNYGVREMVGTPAGLFIAPTSKQAAKSGGGLELWHAE